MIQRIYFCNGKIIKIKDNTYALNEIFFRKVFFYLNLI